MLVTPNSVEPVAKIKVIGVGGAGGNAVKTMIENYNIDGVEFYAFNTDAQALKNNPSPVTLQLGAELTRGLGVGGDHTVGAQAAEESLDDIHEHLAGADMVFITAGMGGGTGTGAAAVIAGVAKNLGALTVAVVTKPFKFEGKHRESVAEEGLEQLKDKVDTLIVVPNQRLLEVIDEEMSFLDAMKEGDKVLAEGVKSISSLVTNSGFINVDFSDVKAIMADAGTSLMGMGRASGDNRAESAARQATNSPLLDMSIEGASGVLLNIVGGENLSMKEIDIAAQMVHEAVDPEANVIFGAAIDPELKDDVVITIVATGFDESKQIHTRGVTQSDETADAYTAPTPTVGSTDDSASTESLSSMSAPDSTTDYGVSVTPGSDESDIPAFMRRNK